jgi:hypothetical protein
MTYVIAFFILFFLFPKFKIISVEMELGQQKENKEKRKATNGRNEEKEGGR